MRNTLYFLILVIFIGACQSTQRDEIQESTTLPIESKNDIIERGENFLKYLKETFDYSPSTQKDGQIFCVLPLDGCDACLNVSIELIKNNLSDNLVIIAATRREQNIKKFDLEELAQEKEKFLIDNKDAAQQYDFGFGYSLLIHIKQNKCVFFSQMDIKGIEKIKEYLSWE